MAALDAIGRLIWLSMLQVLPTKGGADVSGSTLTPLLGDIASRPGRAAADRRAAQMPVHGAQPYPSCRGAEAPTPVAGGDLRIGWQLGHVLQFILDNIFYQE